MDFLLAELDRVKGDKPSPVIKQDERWMLDASLDEYRNLKGTTCDLHRVSRLRRTPSSKEDRHLYEIALKNWQAAVEEQGCIYLKKKVSTWVRYWLDIHICVSRSTHMLA